MGSMPFHLEKGVLGLRLDYLCRSPKAREHVRTRLEAGEDPLAVATDINIPGVGIINVLTDKRPAFAAKLDSLLQVDRTNPDPYERRSGDQYLADHAQLRPANNDNTGNRDAFAKYWMERRAQVAAELKTVLIQALKSDKHHVDFWWECSLEEGKGPAVKLVETEGAAHVMFMTDHGPVQPPDTPQREPLD